MITNAQRIGRPRERRVDEAITTAAQQLLTERGYAAVTVDAVAARAKVGKAAIYRRFATKQEMVFAAAVHDADLRPPPDSGSLLGDLTALAQEITRQLTSPGAASVVLNLLAEAENDPTLVERFTTVFVEVQRAGIAELLERAVRRGELAELPDVDLVHAVFGGTILSWLFILRLNPDGLAERLATLMDAALTRA